MIIREIHLMNELKINILIDNDIFDSKLFDISMFNKSTYIKNCEITISITIASHRYQTKLIHCIKIELISAHTEKLISIHKIFLANQNYFFESANSINFFIYAHLIDIKTNFILIRNDNNKAFRILKNFKLSKIVESEYVNAFQVDTTVSEFAIKSSKSDHQSIWFNKMLAAIANAHTIIVFDSTETILFNEITVHISSIQTINAFTNLINNYSTIWTDQRFVKLSENNWMKLSLKTDWENNVKKKVKVYSLDAKDKKVIDDTFDELQNQDKLAYITESTLFSFSCFVVWRKSPDKKKNKIVVDIRELNVISQFDVYSISLQIDVLQAMQNCIHISIIDCFDFFYQWRIHLSDRHKLTIITHREQKTFNVAIINYRNSSFYVQRQIDRVLRFFQFAKIYIDDIVIFSKSLKKHLNHLKQIFSVLKDNNIFVNFKKIYIDYFSVNLLEQHVNSLNLIIDEQKLKVIAQLTFLATFEQLESYLELTDWFRDYIEKYATKTKSLQNKKIALLKNFFKSKQIKKSYFFKMKITFISEKLKFFRIIQQSFFKSAFLIHFNDHKQLYVNLNFSKNEIDDIVYHVRDTKLSITEYSFKRDVQSILFFSRFLTSAETRYWSIELEIAELVWVLRKIRHLIESSKHATIIYTNHEITLSIAKQITLFIFSTDKFNLRLVRVSNYIQRFNLIIKHKSKKLHIVFDALSRLSSSAKSDQLNDELNVLFIASLIEIDVEFKDRIIEKYIKNSDWHKIIKILNNAKKNQIKLLFLRKNDIIFRKQMNDNTSFVLKRMCIFANAIKNILSMTHDNKHLKFDRTYEKLISVWYIRNFAKHLKSYLKHCSFCKINRTKRHKLYESLQFILSSSISFHTITINFVLVLSVISTDMNNIMSVTCKFSKKITIIFDIDTWNAAQWATALLKRLNFANWNLSKVIIFNKDRKFLSKLWIFLFEQLNVKLLYFTVYHFQTDDVFERTNQILKIALRSFILTLKNSRNWLTLIDFLQRKFNNTFTAVEQSSNEICYDFTSLIDSTLIKNTSVSHETIARIIREQIKNNIAHEQMLAKYYYDNKHDNIQFEMNDWVLLRFHKNYTISSVKILSSKLLSQYIEFFQILERIDNLIYRLKISSNWKVHSVFFVTQLKLVESLMNDSFKRIMLSSNSVFVKNDTKNVKFFEIEKIIITKMNRSREKKFLIRWLKYESEHDLWRNISEMKNVRNLVNEFEQVHMLSNSRRRDRSSKIS